MSFPRPDKMIEQLLADFLADQETRLSSNDYRQYARIIHLYKSYLKRCRPGRAREEYGTAVWPEAMYCGTLENKDLTDGFSEFLDDFLPHVVFADIETMSAAMVVITKLSAWLAAQGDVERHEDTRERTDGIVRTPLETQNLLGLFQDWLAGTSPADYLDDIEDHFLIHRIEPRQIWLESMMAGEVWGPIAVPVSIARACRVGWEISGVVVHSRTGWRLIKVWSVSP
jgi:hypothetical protein